MTAFELPIVSPEGATSQNTYIMFTVALIHKFIRRATVFEAPAEKTP